MFIIERNQNESSRDEHFAGDKYSSDHQPDPTPGIRGYVHMVLYSLRSLCRVSDQSQTPGGRGRQGIASRCFLCLEFLGSELKLFGTAPPQLRLKLGTCYR